MANPIGRPPGPQNRRFASIPRGFDGCIYAAELSNGLLKVGFSRNPRTRMGALAKQVRREFGAQIARFHVGDDMAERAAIRAEMSLIKRIGRLGVVVPGRVEFFQHVAFGAAVTLVRQLSRQPSHRSTANAKA